MSSRSSQRWVILISLTAVIGTALALVFLLAIATNNRGFYEQYYNWLVWLNIAVATILGLVVLLAAARLMMRMWRGKFGSKLLFKLAAIFALVGVLPGALIYTVSYQFVARSIESWFDVRVEGALDAGLNLGRTTLQTFSNDLAAKTRVAAERAADGGVRLTPLALERLREQLGAQSVLLVSGSGRVLIVARDAPGAQPLAIDRPPLTLLKQARTMQVTSVIEGLEQDPPEPGAAAPAGTAPLAPPAARVRAIALIPSVNLDLGTEERYLQVTQALPPRLASDALAVQAAYGEYQQRALGREGLRKMYIGTLTLALILAVFSAVLMASVLGHQLARPLLLLAEGVEQVARGDLRPKEVFASRDELGGLTRSFADMTQQLADARALVQRSLGEVESAKTHLQTILDNLTAGVIVFDHDGRIEMINPGATRILRAPLSAYIGRPLGDLPGLSDFAAAVYQRIDASATDPDAAQPGQWQDSFELLTGPAQAPVTLLMRGASLPDDARLLVFDDITEVVSAQRSVAWAEVARRLAHEIKNPLTPIQLSAERLQHKLAARLETPDRQMLERSVDTIVSQVQSMKHLVNEFRDYARLPSTKPQPLDLSALADEVLGLYGAAIESGRLVSLFEPGTPQVMGDASQLRQVIHNLVQNSFDAVAERPDGRVVVSIETARNDDGSPRAVRLKVVDNGPGFSQKVLARAFEPYVTTKPKGTGLGLAVVKKIAEEHGARVRLTNLHEGAAPGTEADTDPTGAQVSISFSSLVPAEGLPPRANPSITAPQRTTDSSESGSSLSTSR